MDASPKTACEGTATKISKTRSYWAKVDFKSLVKSINWHPCGYSASQTDAKQTATITKRNERTERTQEQELRGKMGDLKTGNNQRGQTKGTEGKEGKRREGKEGKARRGAIPHMDAHGFFKGSHF